MRKKEKERERKRKKEKERERKKEREREREKKKQGTHCLGVIHGTDVLDRGPKSKIYKLGEFC